MAAEIAEAPAVVARQAEALAQPVAALAQRLRHQPPVVVVTCARGSSGHAATFAKHLIELTLGIPVAAAAPSIATVYQRELRLGGQLFLAVSQSGRSDDLIELTANARRAGALTVGVINVADSPLAEVCELVLPVCAGPEHSVAATKTVVGTLSVFLRLAAAWTADAEMRDAAAALPDRLHGAAEAHWDAAVETIVPATSLVTIGRGPTLAIAREAALKLKETCSLHAEAFSAAEFRHGPLVLVERDSPVILFRPADAAGDTVGALTDDLRRKGAAVLTAGDGGTLPAGAAAADAICQLQAFYGAAVRIAARRGLDVDRPRHLRKVTRTR